MSLENISNLHYKPEETYDPNVTYDDQETWAPEGDLLEKDIWALLETSYEELQLAEKENRLEDMLVILNKLNDSLPSYPCPPLVQMLVFFSKITLFFKKSNIHETLGQLELALEDIDQIPQILQTTDIPLEFKDSYNHYVLRRGALLLSLGRKEEAVEVLRNHTPKDTATVLLYKFLEQKFDISLLNVTKPSSSNPKSLFLAGHFEKAASLVKENPYEQLLYADCLTMLGRIEEAREIRKNEAAAKYYLDEDFKPEYSMLLILHGDLPDPLPWNHDSWELFYNFPLKTFWNLHRS